MPPQNPGQIPDEPQYKSAVESHLRKETLRSFPRSAIPETITEFRLWIEAKGELAAENGHG
jgi:hypothetical protein